METYPMLAVLDELGLWYLSLYDGSFDLKPRGQQGVERTRSNSRNDKVCSLRDALEGQSTGKLTNWQGGNEMYLV